MVFHFQQNRQNLSWLKLYTMMISINCFVMRACISYFFPLLVLLEVLTLCLHIRLTSGYVLYVTDNVYCSLHRLPELHGCDFDHKEDGRREAREKMVKPTRHLGTSFRRLDSDSWSELFNSWLLLVEKDSLVKFLKAVFVS